MKTTALGEEYERLVAGGLHLIENKKTSKRLISQSIDIKHPQY